MVGVHWTVEMIGSCPHIAVAVVLVCPHFPSLRYVYILCLISLTMSSYVSFRNDRFMTSYGGSSWNFLRAGHRRKGSIRSERRKIMHALGWYGRDCRRCIWHVLPAVLKILEHDTGDIKALWSQSIYRFVLLCIVTMQEDIILISGGKGKLMTWVSSVISILIKVFS